MAMKPKLSPEQWADVRRRWEADAREGYTWIMKEMFLPVSAQAIGKVARREAWAKASKSGRSSKGAAGSRPEVGIFVEVIGAKVCAIDRLPEKQQMFCREYVVDFNGTQAAIRAGYSERGADVQASRLLGNAKVQSALRELTTDRVQRLGIDADRIMQRWHDIMTVDPNQLTQYRRVCCRHCWGQDFQYQYKPGEYRDAKLRHAEKRADTLWKTDQKVDIGDFPVPTGDWYDKRRDPNAACPECFGEGLGETFFHDTRRLSPAALALYAGVKEGREGIEILTASQEKAAENLARALGLFKDRDVEVNVNVPGGEDLALLYSERMEKARARQAKVIAERLLERNSNE